MIFDVERREENKRGSKAWIALLLLFLGWKFGLGETTDDKKEGGGGGGGTDNRIIYLKIDGYARPADRGYFVADTKIAPLETPPADVAALLELGPGVEIQVDASHGPHKIVADFLTAAKATGAKVHVERS